VKQINYTPIGIIHSPFESPRGTPIQPSAASGVEGFVEVLPQYVSGLQDLEGFSHIMLLYHCHLSKDFNLQVKPFLDDTLRGVYATRAPARPNPIGLSIVRLVGVEDSKLLILDVDIVNGTPLLDIKPYVPLFDIRQDATNGWLEDKAPGLADKRDDGRFTMAGQRHSNPANT
jgi:tRNA-Thr(GGU) m(6)t(6)A37 methyltransferase TsaA